MLRLRSLQPYHSSRSEQRGLFVWSVDVREPSCPIDLDTIPGHPPVCSGDSLRAERLVDFLAAGLRAGDSSHEAFRERSHS